MRQSEGRQLVRERQGQCRLLGAGGPGMDNNHKGALISFAGSTCWTGFCLFVVLFSYEF